VGLLVSPHIISACWIQKVSGLFMLETYSRFLSIKDIFKAIVVAGLLFMATDFLLSKMFGRNNITIV